MSSFPARRDIPREGIVRASTHGDHSAHEAGAVPGGLQISQDGNTLDLADTIPEPGTSLLRFRILGPDGDPVTDYAPIRDHDDTWSVRLDLPEAGAYRVFTVVSPRGLGHTITLGADLAVSGLYEPRPTPQPAGLFTVDGYQIELTGDLVAGEGRNLTMTVTRDGQPVTGLQPYLAAYGHVVVLRAGDLAHVHVHPDGAPGDGVTEPGPDICFHAVVPGRVHPRRAPAGSARSLIRPGRFVVTGARRLKPHLVRGFGVQVPDRADPPSGR
ncbi:hypothetical protein KGQ20_30965 [Catenulispora sp. NF23]|uniref:hypothetical protein n=1 Tax=Catenulispora pinistramenti TaxID=2705254 RepID=UPI001BA658BF|nr:hypothetical protein [Catenulispora pinistramenti]MBS2537187.1 hypothetical protein [Catenulispora pinistramenti]